jgi:hypothetical protein
LASVLWWAVFSWGLTVCCTFFWYLGMRTWCINIIIE